jgi:DNA mismatch repair protein MutS2
MSSLGKEKVDEMAFTQEIAVIHELLQQTKDFRLLQEEHDDFPLNYFFDVRESVARLRLEGTHMEEEELFDLKRSLETIIAIVKFLRNNENDDLNDDDNHPYPSLYRLTEGIVTFPQLVQRIDQILGKFGNIKDTASTELARIRKELAKMEGSVSRTLYNILRTAQSEGLVEKDTTPTLRDGRLVIPIAPNMKRRISGIVHDESASGKTLFIEPTEVV